MTSPPSAWQLNYPRARLQTDIWAASIDVTRASHGLGALSVQGHEVRGELMRVAVGAPGETGRGAVEGECETYVRGADLVSTYDRLRTDAVRSTIYWRAGNEESTDGLGARLSLIVSVETDRLDSYPAVDVSTELAVDEVALLPMGDQDVAGAETMRGETSVQLTAEESAHVCVLLRPSGCEFSLVEMTHPSDFQEIRVEQTSGQARIMWQLLGQFLEKGVIRRARMQAAWLLREDDERAATKCYQAFAMSEAPLTA